MQTEEDFEMPGLEFVVSTCIKIHVLLTVNSFNDSLKPDVMYTLMVYIFQYIVLILLNSFCQTICCTTKVIAQEVSLLVHRLVVFQIIFFTNTVVYDVY